MLPLFSLETNVYIKFLKAFNFISIKVILSQKEVVFILSYPSLKFRNEILALFFYIEPYKPVEFHFVQIMFPLFQMQSSLSSNFVGFSPPRRFITDTCEIISASKQTPLFVFVQQIEKLFALLLNIQL